MNYPSVVKAFCLSLVLFTISGCAPPDDMAYQSPHPTKYHKPQSHASGHSVKPHKRGSKRHYTNRNYTPSVGSKRSVAMIRAAGGLVIQRGQIMRVILPYDKFFDSYNEDKIKVSKRGALLTLAKLLNRNYHLSPIRVIGFTDSSGAHVEQVDRARRTAEVVYSYLWDHNVSTHRMSLISAGSSKPIGSDAGFFAGWSDNRRVEIRVGLPLIEGN